MNHMSAGGSCSTKLNAKPACATEMDPAEHWYTADMQHARMTMLPSDSSAVEINSCAAIHASVARAKSSQSSQWR